MFGIRPGNRSEPPPEEVRGLPLPEGWKVYRQATAADVDRVCRMYGAQTSQYNKATIEACASPHLAAIIMPPEGHLPPKVDAALLDHEGNGHGRGYVHKPNSADGWAKYDMPPPIIPRAAVDAAMAALFAEAEAKQPKRGLFAIGAAPR